MRGCAPSSIQFGFDYEFASSTDYYTSGKFDAALLRMLERIEKVMAIMLPSLARGARGELFAVPADLPAHRRWCCYVPVTAHDAKAGTISYDDPETRESVTVPVTGGHCKLQWKPDWAMRWFALGVDYEMAGKDLINSVKLSGKICSALGGTPPEGFNYELFLDEKGQKISKSKGNGLTIDEWLRYASPKSLSLFMYREPKAAKRLYFDVIPRNVDDYQQFLDGFPRQDAKQQLANPVWHIHAGKPPTGRHAGHVPAAADAGVVVECGECRDAVGFHRPLSSRRDAADPSEARCDGRLRHQLLSRLRGADEEIPRADRRRARRAAGSARCAVATCRRGRRAEDIQNVVYEIGRREPFLDHVKKGKDGRPGVSLDWFNMLYQVLLGQEKGPRFGSFVAVYGVPNAVAMIDGALARIGVAFFLLALWEQVTKAIATG